MLTILAEPAVHVLTDQIEEVTAGYVNKENSFRNAFHRSWSCSCIKRCENFSSIIATMASTTSGFGISVIMSYFVPPLFVGIAYDSGGVASGPMTATFILAYTQGVAEALKEQMYW